MPAVAQPMRIFAWLWSPTSVNVRDACAAHMANACRIHSPFRVTCQLVGVIDKVIIDIRAGLVRDRVVSGNSGPFLRPPRQAIVLVAVVIRNGA
jgi:hypothetical protein